MTQPSGAQAKVTQAWRAAISDLEKGRTRRGKATAKLGRIDRVFIKNAAIEARIKGFGGGFGSGSYALSFPCVDWWEEYQTQVATWLARRPDWLAALLADQWDESFVAFAHQAGLHLLPDETYAEKLQTLSTCTCSEASMPCQHILMVIYDIMEEVSTKPLRMFSYLGLSVDALLDEVHRLSLVDGEDNQANQAKALTSAVPDTRGAAPSGLVPWPEEAGLRQGARSAGGAPSRVITPNLNSERLATWRRNQMACELADPSS